MVIECTELGKRKTKNIDKAALTQTQAEEVHTGEHKISRNKAQRTQLLHSRPAAITTRLVLQVSWAQQLLQKQQEGLINFSRPDKF